MKIETSKKSATIALILVLAFATLIASVASVEAADVETRAFLSVNPNPAGVNQYVDVTVWLQPIPPSAVDVLHGFQVTITKPDGSVDSRGPLTSSPIGSQFFEYTPTMVGTYRFKVSYPGEAFAGGTITYSPSESPETELVVQESPVPEWSENPIPTGYWTRPINSLNRNWWPIAGNWLQRGYNATYGAWDSAHAFNPYSQAPRAPHVVWTKELTFGGVTGGEYGTTSYYAGLSYEPKLAPPIVMNGRLYYNTYAGYFGPPAVPGFMCVDLRTGEEIFRNNDYIISQGQLFNFISPNQMGFQAYLWNLGMLDYQMFDAFTGKLVLTFANATGVGFLTTVSNKVVYGNDGTMFVYLLDGTNGWLALWNSTKAFERNFLLLPQESGTLQFTPFPGTYNWNAGVEWNTTVPVNSVVTPETRGLPSFPSLSFGGVAGDVVVATAGGITNARLHVGYSAKTGEQLWVFDRLKGSRQFPVWIGFGEGIYAQWEPFEMKWIAYDLNTGQEKWAGDPAVYPWGVYLGNTGPTIAYGKLYSPNYDGYMHAIDVNTGKELWKFSSGNSGRETPYGTYPMYYGPVIADGVAFISTGEHSPTQPSIRGEKIFAVNAENGQELWRMNGQMALQAIADGYLVGYNAYDNRIYCIGKGPSATTVTASPKIIAEGLSVMIEGTVTDQSSGQPGTPAIADSDMAAWMEYLKQQQPMPTHVTGVPVKLSAHRADGSTIDITTVTSDGYGHFGYMWNPPEKGTFTIVAEFAGSDSYGSSSADTSVGVEAASTSTTAAEQGFSTTDIVIVVAVVIAIIIGLVNLALLRRRKQ